MQGSGAAKNVLIRSASLSLGKKEYDQRNLDEIEKRLVNTLANRRSIGDAYLVSCTCREETVKSQ